VARPPDNRGVDGYALIDALVALFIMAMALILSLQATAQARRAATQAWEVRRAQTLLAHLAEIGPRSFEDTSGFSDGFAWRIETRTTGGERPIEVCRRKVRIDNVRSHRTYELATLTACPMASVG